MSRPDLKKDSKSGANEHKSSVSSSTPGTDLDQVRPGTPWGVALPHIYTHARHALGTSESIKAAYARLDLPEILKRRIIGFLGNFGSGKTEVAVNFAMQLALAASDSENEFSGSVRIADLDIVNPYFRSREASEPLSEAGVEVISPSGENFWADLPIILPEIKGRLKDQDGTLILDVGGDDLGAKVLSHLNDDFARGEYALLMVVNANRPFTSSVDGARKVLSELETAAGLKIEGLVSNTHLMDETDPDVIRHGYRFTLEMSEAAGVPVVMVAAEHRLIDSGAGMGGVKQDEFNCPLLPLYRFMLPPWRTAHKGE
ncbi:MAG TPA: cobalamin biosynthesis protein CbiA [Firmicutes bacterium]|nr:cobalamin biosynthesis protein CbiA [Bacillota bacterium]